MTSRVWLALKKTAIAVPHRRSPSCRHRLSQTVHRNSSSSSGFPRNCGAPGIPSSGPILSAPECRRGHRLRVCVCLHDQPGRGQIQHRMQRFTQPDVERPRLTLHHDRCRLRAGLRTHQGQHQASGQHDHREYQACRQRLQRRAHRFVDGAKVSAQQRALDAPPQESMPADLQPAWSVAMPSRFTVGTGRFAHDALRDPQPDAVRP